MSKVYRRMTTLKNTKEFCECCGKGKLFFYRNTGVCTTCIGTIPRYIPDIQVERYLEEWKRKALMLI